MLLQFPGRTLDELDAMDILRYFRAMDARNVDTLEDTIHQIQTGKKKGSEVDKDDWDKIREHEKIWDKFITPKGE